MFTVSSDFQLVEEEFLNASIFNWVNEERFVAFPKVTRSNIHQISQTQKFLVLAVVEENKLSEIASHELEFRDMIESIIRQKYDKYHQKFQFGWIGTPDIAHSIVMDQLPTPHLIVLNTTTYEHYIPDDEPERLTADAIELFLHNIHHDKVKVRISNSNLIRKVEYMIEIYCEDVNIVNSYRDSVHEKHSFVCWMKLPNRFKMNLFI